VVITGAWGVGKSELAGSVAASTEFAGPFLDADNHAEIVRRMKGKFNDADCAVAAASNVESWASSRQINKSLREDRLFIVNLLADDQTRAMNILLRNLAGKPHASQREREAAAQQLGPQIQRDLALSPNHRSANAVYNLDWSRQNRLSVQEVRSIGHIYDAQQRP